MISSSLAESMPASWDRALAIAARGRSPSWWLLEGFPKCSSRNGNIARVTEGATGVVAKEMKPALKRLDLGEDTLCWLQKIAKLETIRFFHLLVN